MKENQALRQYVVTLTLRQEIGTAIPPERELAKTFGVCRETLRNTLDSLSGEGLLRRVPRRGYFVARSPLSKYEQQKPTFGLVTFGGKVAIVAGEDLEVMEALFAEAISQRINLELLTTTEMDRFANEMRQSKLDGLLWYSVPGDCVTYFEQLAATGFPVVGIFQEQVIPKTGDYLFLDHKRQLVMMLNYLFERGSKKICRTRIPDRLDLNDFFDAEFIRRGCPDAQLILTDE